VAGSRTEVGNRSGQAQDSRLSCFLEEALLSFFVSSKKLTRELIMQDARASAETEKGTAAQKRWLRLVAAIERLSAARSLDEIVGTVRTSGETGTQSGVFS